MLAVHQPVIQVEFVILVLLAMWNQEQIVYNAQVHVLNVQQIKLLALNV